MPANDNGRPQRRPDSGEDLEKRVRNAQRAAANASWQLLLGFGVSFAVRVGLLGIWLGGWIDKRWLGGTGIGAAAIIVLVIFYSFYMLYADLCRLERRVQAEKAQAEAEYMQKILKK